MEEARIHEIHGQGSGGDGDPKNKGLDEMTTRGLAEDELQELVRKVSGMLGLLGPEGLASAVGEPAAPAARVRPDDELQELARKAYGLRFIILASCENRPTTIYSEVTGCKLHSRSI